MTDTSELRVIIPVGGEARRLRPLTAETSKAVVRLLNRPLVEFAMAELARQGVRRFVFGAKGYLNYRSLFDYFRDGLGFSAQYGLQPRAEVEYQPRIDDVGSADSVRILMDYYGIDEEFLVVQGDNLFTFDLERLLEFRRAKGAFMVVVLTEVEDVEAYGIAELGPDGRIRRFVEKPARGSEPSRLANTGIYLISPDLAKVFEEPDVQRMIHFGKRLDFGLDMIPYLVERYPVYGYRLEGDWKDVGTPRGYLDAVTSVLAAHSRPGLNLGEPVVGLPTVWIQGGNGASAKRREEVVKKIAAGRLRPEGSVLIGSECQIGDGTTIRDSAIDNSCVIGRNVVIERSAVMDRAVIEDGAVIQDSIVGRHVRVASSDASPTKVTGVSVLGDDCFVGEGAWIESAKVDPHTAVKPGSRLRADEVG